MINSNSTSNIVTVTSLLSFGCLFFIGLAIPDRYEIIKTGYDVSFFALIVGYVLRQKNIQQLIGLFIYLVYFNMDMLKSEPFQIQNDEILHFARLNSFFAIAISMVLIFPTLFDKYQLAPLTNSTNIKNSTIILTVITLTVLLQTIIRLAVWREESQTANSHLQ